MFTSGCWWNRSPARQASLNADAGPLKATLHASTTGTDADWVIKLIDVYAGDFPDPKPNPAYVAMGGYQQLVRGDVFRGKFRNSFEKPEPFKKGSLMGDRHERHHGHHPTRKKTKTADKKRRSWLPEIFLPLDRSR